MKRQKRFKKIKLLSVFGDFKDFMVKKVVTVVITAVFILTAFLLAKAFLYRSDYFKVRTIETREALLDQKTMIGVNNQLLNLYKGRNIFSIDLKYISRSLQASYPAAKEVIVRSSLPDRLVILMKFRRAVALVKNLNRSYVIDEDGVALPGADINTMKDLPVIEGIKKFDARNLRLALDLLKEIKKARFMARYGLERIDALDARNLSFYLKNGIEIRIGSENFRERLDLLGNTLRDPRLVMDMIKYIDVRFKDVVIGPK